MIFFKNNIKFTQSKKAKKKLNTSVFFLKKKNYKHLIKYKKKIPFKCSIDGKKKILSKLSCKDNFIFFKKLNLNLFFLIKSFFFNIRSNFFLTEIIYSNGLNFFLKSLSNHVTGYIYYTHSLLNNIVQINVGDVLPILFLKNNLIISNIIEFNLNTKKKNIFSSSYGTKSSIYFIDFNYKKVIIILPSKKKKLFKITTYCSLGDNLGKSSKLFLNKTAGLNIRLGKKPIVRGVAKNACDHPNGGNTKKKKKWKTPWGKLAKLSK